MIVALTRVQIYDLMVQGPVKVNMADLFQQLSYTWMFDFLFQDWSGGVGATSSMVVLHRD